MYCMLIGSPGTRKSTAIKVMGKLMKLAGYTTIAANRTSKEKWLLDLSEGGDELAIGQDILDKNLWGTDDSTSNVTECAIMADEFNNFIGVGNLDFISLLTELWDYEGVFYNKIKTGKSVAIPNPTITILGGNTPVGFSTAFPVAILGQGFFSRLLLVYGEPNGKKYLLPRVPSETETADMVADLQEIKIKCYGQATLTHSAQLLLEKIYKKAHPNLDIRFESYFSRRLNHLLKLCLIVTASRLSTVITELDIVHANTLLTHTEHLMPKALGEFGKAKHSDVTHKIVTLLDTTTRALQFKDIWVHVRNDLDKMGDLSELLNNLIAADLVQALKGAPGGFLPKRRILEEVNDDTLDYSILTQEEREIKK